MRVNKKITARSKIIYAGICLFSLVIIAQIINLQFISNEKWERKAAQNIIKEELIEAGRGNILAQNNAILAISTPYFVLSWDTRFPKGKDSLRYFYNGLDSLADSLSRFFGDATKKEYREQLLKARYSKKAYYIINKRPLSFDEKERMKKWPFFRYKTGNTGIRFEKKELRTYPYDSLARKTIGSIYYDTNRKVSGTGIEFAFNKELSGTEGKKIMQKVGTEFQPVMEAGEIEAIDGYDVVTTLDVQIQDITYQALKQAVKTTQAKYGVALVMEVKTGKLRAVANYPEIYQYALAQLIEPGSTFKSASMLACIEDKHITTSDTLQTGGGKWQFYDRTMTDTKPHYLLTAQKAFEESSNIYHARMIQKYYGKNPVAFFNHLERFGLTEPTGIEILGEPAPYFIKPDDKRLWNATTLPWLSTGYNARLTPLQILTFYNAIANGGYRVKPMLIEEIRKTTKVVRKYPVQVSKEPVCSKESLAIIQKMLEGVVKRGTAKNIYTPNYAIAGKTGTAQKVINGQYQKTYEASFVGYFPAKNPVYSIYVLLDEPQEGFYGAAVAAPVFQQIANQLFAMNQKAQEFRDIKNTISAELPTVKKAFSKDLQTIYNELSIAYQGTDTGNWVSSSIIPGKKAVKISSEKISIYNKVIPNLKGMALKDAIYLLENMKVKVLYEGQGKVVTQSLDTGTLVKPDMTIMLKCE